MACATVSAVSVAAPVFAAAGLGESTVLSRKNVVLGAPMCRRSPSPLVCNRSRLTMSAESPKQASVAGLTAAALVIAAVVPEIAEAAAPGVSPSLKNLLLSVVAGGIVFAGIGTVVAGISTFDPVNRR